MCRRLVRGASAGLRDALMIYSEQFLDAQPQGLEQRHFFHVRNEMNEVYDDSRSWARDSARSKRALEGLHFCAVRVTVLGGLRRVGLFLRQDDDLDGTVDYHLSKCNRTLVIQPGTMVRTVCAPHGSACRFESGPRHAVRPVSVCSRRGQRERMMHVGAGRHSIRWRYAGLKRRL